jgi:DNA-binding NarL/FixJ family response regulator
VSRSVARQRVVLADDDVLLREGLASLLSRHGFDVVGQAGDGAHLLEIVREHAADLDVAIIDIRMPPGSTTEGLEAARKIREQFPSIAILVLSAYIEVNHALALLASGDSIGYVLKSRVNKVEELIDALGRISAGGSVIDSTLVHELFAMQHRDDPITRLSPREREVLELMAEGLSNAGIAQKMWITEGTVEKHVHSVLTKLNLPEDSAGHRRVLAVLTVLDSRRHRLL